MIWMEKLNFECHFRGRRKGGVEWRSLTLDVSLRGRSWKSWMWEKLSLTLEPPRYALEKVTETRKKEDFGKARLLHFYLLFQLLTVGEM